MGGPFAPVCAVAHEAGQAVPARRWSWKARRCGSSPRRAGLGLLIDRTRCIHGCSGKPGEIVMQGLIDPRPEESVRRGGGALKVRGSAQ